MPSSDSVPQIDPRILFNTDPKLVTLKLPKLKIPDSDLISNSDDEHEMQPVPYLLKDTWSDFRRESLSGNAKKKIRKHGKF